MMNLSPIAAERWSRALVEEAERAGFAAFMPTIYRKLSWRERLLSWPWRPLRKYCLVEPAVTENPTDKITFGQRTTFS